MSAAILGGGGGGSGSGSSSLLQINIEFFFLGMLRCARLDGELHAAGPGGSVAHVPGAVRHGRVG